MAKYDGLATHLSHLPAEQHEAELSFGAIDALIGEPCLVASRVARRARGPHWGCRLARGRPASAGIYQFRLGGLAGRRDGVYVGESENIRRRLAGNYRNPGPTQQTSLRLNGLLLAQLDRGGAVVVDVVDEAVLIPPCGEAAPLDLSRKASRLLVENAALVLAQHAGHTDLLNLG